MVPSPTTCSSVKSQSWTTGVPQGTLSWRLLSVVTPVPSLLSQANDVVVESSVPVRSAAMAEPAGTSTPAATTAARSRREVRVMLAPNARCTGFLRILSGDAVLDGAQTLDLDSHHVAALQ